MLGVSIFLIVGGRRCTINMINSKIMSEQLSYKTVVSPRTVFAHNSAGFRPFGLRTCTQKYTYKNQFLSNYGIDWAHVRRFYVGISISNLSEFKLIVSLSLFFVRGLDGVAGGHGD